MFPASVSTTKKYRLVGEAVPPILAYRLAVALGRTLGLPTREPPREEEWALPYFKRAFADYLARGLRGEALETGRSGGRCPQRTADI
jgi:hypothetical protein